MDNTSQITLLRQFPLFENITVEELSFLAKVTEYKIKSKYNFLYLPGEASDRILFLVKGTVKIGTHSNDGKEIIKSILHPLAMFGELGIVGEEERQDFAKAMNEEVHYYSLKVSDFQKIMQANSHVANKILLLMGSRLRKAESRLESLIFKDARTRIIDFIRDSAITRGRKVGFEMLVKHSLTQQDIANITGTSRQTVTSVLNELKKSNLIFFNRRTILIRDLAKLA